MSTIDQLMSDKAPGEIKICRPNQSGWFQPFFKAKGEWWGRTHEDQSFWDIDYSDWTIYQAPKPTKVVYEWMLLEDDKSWNIDGGLMTEEEAKEYYKYKRVPFYKKTGRSFTVECE